ncbi:MAG: hypothetical protein OEO77_05895 [Acidimicrobiia bacterium]|nr:hypothetical protein [Acidimicrobiia bacterium]
MRAWLLASAAVLYGLHRLATCADARDWIYYRRTSPGTGRAVMSVAQIFAPAIEHVIEEERSKELQGQTIDTDQPVISDPTSTPLSGAPEPRSS